MRCPAFGEPHAVGRALEDVLEPEAGAAYVRAAKPDPDHVVEPRRNAIAQVHLDDGRLVSLVAEGLVAAGELR